MRAQIQIAGICAKGGYEYAVSVYHYAMALAYAAQSETLKYHQDNSRSEAAFDRASWHLQQLEVCCRTAVEATSNTSVKPQKSGFVYLCCFT